MKLGSLLAFGAGLALTVFLIVSVGVDAVGAAVGDAGWGAVLAITFFNAIPIAVCGVAWRVLLVPAPRQATLLMIWVRFLRSSISELVPISGELIAIRVMTLHGVRGGIAGASAVVDMTVELLSQLAFTALGLLLLVLDGRASTLAAWALVGLVGAIPMVIGFLVAQRLGLFRWLQNLPYRLARHVPWARLPELGGLHDEIQTIYRHPGLIWLGFLWHSLGWVVGVGEAWLAFYFLGADVGFAAVLVIESLSFALRSAAFLVPGALGVQEGGYIALGALFGLGPEVGLALSLLKRAREVLLAVPAFLAWQLIEGRAWRRRAALAAVAGRPGD